MYRAPIPNRCKSSQNCIGAQPDASGTPRGNLEDAEPLSAYNFEKLLGMGKAPNLQVQHARFGILFPCVCVLDGDGTETVFCFWKMWVNCSV